MRVIRKEIPEDGLLYDVLHGAPASLAHSLNGSHILEAIVMHDNEELPQQWVADLGGRWKPDFRLPGGHELKILSSLMKLYDSPKPSSSDDSDHFYLAYSIELGLLLQFANSEPWRTKDPVGHSSVHNGHDEAFYAVHDSAQVWLTEKGKQPVLAHLGTDYTKAGTGFKEQQVVAVNSGMWHPVVAFSPAIILIHGPPEMVKDQVNGTSFCHKNGLVFRETYADLLKYVDVLRRV